MLDDLPTHAGLPVPWSAPILADGRPNFRGIDRDKNRESVRFQLCRICGKWIPNTAGRGAFGFIVGPLCLQEGMVFDGPGHETCLLAALRLCPYLAQRDWQRYSTRKGGSGKEFVEAVPLEQLPPKPDRVGLAVVERYRGEQGPNGLWYSAIGKPFRLAWFVYGQDGKLVEEAGR